jgi:hypothetical protein
VSASCDKIPVTHTKIANEVKTAHNVLTNCVHSAESALWALAAMAMQ